MWHDTHTAQILYNNSKFYKIYIYYALSKTLIAWPKSSKQNPCNAGYRLEFIRIPNPTYCEVIWSISCIWTKLLLPFCQTSCTFVVHKYGLLLHNECNQPPVMKYGIIRWIKICIVQLPVLSTSMILRVRVTMNRY